MSVNMSVHMLFSNVMGTRRWLFFTSSSLIIHSSQFYSSSSEINQGLQYTCQRQI